MQATAIYNYKCNGLEDLCVSVIGICCLGRPGFRVLSPVLQLFVIYFFNFFILSFNVFYRIQGLHFREGKSN